MAGPTEGAKFEPEEVKVGGREGLSLAECNDISFKLKGFSLSMPLKVRLADGRLAPGPSDVKLRLSIRTPNHDVKAGRGNVFESIYTDGNGISTFSDLK